MSTTIVMITDVVEKTTSNGSGYLSGTMLIKGEPGEHKFKIWDANLAYSKAHEGAILVVDARYEPEYDNYVMEVESEATEFSKSDFLDHYNKALEFSKSQLIPMVDALLSEGHRGILSTYLNGLDIESAVGAGRSHVMPGAIYSQATRNMLNLFYTLKTTAHIKDSIDTNLTILALVMMDFAPALHSDPRIALSKFLAKNEDYIVEKLGQTSYDTLFGIVLSDVFHISSREGYVVHTIRDASDMFQNLDDKISPSGSFTVGNYRGRPLTIR